MKVTARNQEAATDAIRADPTKKIGKIQGVQIITAGHLSALAVHEVIPGADILIAASSRIPYHLVRGWQAAGKRQIWLEGFSSREITEIVNRLNYAGWHDPIFGPAAITAADRMAVADDKEKEGCETGVTEVTDTISEPEVTERREETVTDKTTTSPDLVPVDLKVIRSSAWDILTTMGADALIQYLRDADPVFTPKKMRVGNQDQEKDNDNEGQERNGDADAATTGKSPKPKSARPAGAPSAAQRLLRSFRKTGKTRADRDLYFHDMDAATQYLNQCLDDGKEHHLNGEVAITGLGKTYAAQALMLDAKVPFIIVAPTNDLAKQIYEGLLKMQANGIGVNRAVALHQPRNEETCQRFSLVKILQEASRGPYAQACKMSDLENSVPGDCPHAETCQYLQQLKRTAEADIVGLPTRRWAATRAC